MSKQADKIKSIAEKAAKIKNTSEKKHITAHEGVKRSVGRKPKQKGEKYDRRTTVYFKEDQYEIINEYCDLLNISVNEFIRDTVMEKLNKQDSEDVIDIFIDGISAEKLGECVKDFLRG